MYGTFINLMFYGREIKMNVDVELLQDILRSIQERVRDQNVAILRIYRQLSNLSKLLADMIDDKSVDMRVRIIDFASGLLDDIEKLYSNTEGK